MAPLYPDNLHTLAGGNGGLKGETPSGHLHGRSSGRAEAPPGDQPSKKGNAEEKHSVDTLRRQTVGYQSRALRPVLVRGRESTYRGFVEREL